MRVDLPYNEDAEHAVLSAGLNDTGALTKLVGLLKPESFYVGRHQVIWNAMRSLWSIGVEVDPLTLCDELAKSHDLERAGGKDYIGFLIDVVPTTDHCEHHAEIVLEHAERRRVIQRAEAAIADAREGKTGAREIAAALSATLVEMAVGVGKRGFKGVRDIVGPVLQGVEDRFNGRVPPGVPTGYAAIDKHIGGLRPGELTILAAVPGGGKTALALNIVLNAAERGHECAVVSAEMGDHPLVERLLANLASIDSTILRSGKLNDDEWKNLMAAADHLAKLPVYIDDSARPTIQDITARVRGLKAKHPGLGLVVVDFIQLIRHGSEDQMALALTNITYDLKGLAKELSLHVIATCQVDAAAVEKSDNPRPRIHHLRWSQGIREGADMVGMCFRPKMYDPTARDVLEIFWEKMRDLPVYEVILRWVGRYMRVSDDHETLGRAA